MIVDFTQHNDVDHLVLGRRSMGDQERKLLGSTTDYCSFLVFNRNLSFLCPFVDQFSVFSQVFDMLMEMSSL
jgi:hypothetical protein